MRAAANSWGRVGGRQARAWGRGHPHPSLLPSREKGYVVPVFTRMTLLRFGLGFQSLGWSRALDSRPRFREGDVLSRE